MLPPPPGPIPSIKTWGGPRRPVWGDGWMDGEEAFRGRIPSTHAMKPEPRAHEPDRFTVLSQPATGVRWVVTTPHAPLRCLRGPRQSTTRPQMVGSKSTLDPPLCTNVGRQRLASSTLHPVSAVGSGQSGVGMGTVSGHFKDTKRQRCPKLIWGHCHGQNERHV